MPAHGCVTNDPTPSTSQYQTLQRSGSTSDRREKDPLLTGEDVLRDNSGPFVVGNRFNFFRFSWSLGSDQELIVIANSTFRDPSDERAHWEHAGVPSAIFIVSTAHQRKQTW